MTVERVRTNERVRVLPRKFYESVLTEAERGDFVAAFEVEGVDEEIALLRLRLRSALRDRPEDLPLLFKGVDLLVRLVVRRYGLPKQSAEDFQGAIEKVLASLSLDSPPEAESDA